MSGQSGSLWILGRCLGRRDHAGSLVVVGLLLTILPVLKGDNTREYCINEHFQADCSANEVIVVDKALYGRMKIGRCVRRNYGYVGCTNDVTEPLTWHCSGQQNCRIDNIAATLDAYKKECAPDLQSYLETSFHCLPVASERNEDCVSLRYLSLTSTSGSLSSSLTYTRQLGSHKCPWIINAQPGQYINLTLQDFSPSLASSSGTVQNSEHASYCREYAVVTETSTAAIVERCHGDPATKHVYLSFSHRVQVELRAPALQEDVRDTRPHFLIHYQVIGCPYPEPPEDAYLVPGGKDGELEIRCNHTEQAWKLECKDNRWQGNVGNCTVIVPMQEKGLGPLLPYGVSVIIIFAVAILICLVILSIGVLHLRRRRPSSEIYQPENLGYPIVRSNSAPNSPTQKLATIQRHATLDGPHHHRGGNFTPCLERAYHPMTRTLRTTASRDGKYTHVWELRHQPQCVVGAAMVGGATQIPMEQCQQQQPNVVPQHFQQQQQQQQQHPQPHIHHHPQQQDGQMIIGAPPQQQQLDDDQTLHRCTCPHPQQQPLAQQQQQQPQQSPQHHPGQQQEDDDDEEDENQPPPPPKMCAEPDLIMQDGSCMPHTFSTFKPVRSEHIYESPHFDALTGKRSAGPRVFFELDAKPQNRQQESDTGVGAI